MKKIKEDQNDHGAVSATAVDGSPCSVPADSASHVGSGTTETASIVDTATPEMLWREIRRLGLLVRTLSRELADGQSALERIRNGDDSCRCEDHAAPECCANADYDKCAYCIAAQALEKVDRGKR